MSEINCRTDKTNPWRVPQNILWHRLAPAMLEYRSHFLCVCLFVCTGVCVPACSHVPPTPRAQHYQLLDDPLHQGGEADVVAVPVVVHVLDQFGDALRVRL